MKAVNKQGSSLEFCRSGLTFPWKAVQMVYIPKISCYPNYLARSLTRLWKASFPFEMPFCLASSVFTRSAKDMLKHDTNSVVFRESVCTRWFWEKGLCRKSSLSWNSNLGYLKAIKCHFEFEYGRFGHFLSRIQSYFISAHCDWARKGFCRKFSPSWNSKFRVFRGTYVPFSGKKLNTWTFYD